MNEQPKSYIIVSEKSAWTVSASIALLVLAFSAWSAADLRWAFDRGYDAGVATESSQKLLIGAAK